MIRRPPRSTLSSSSAASDVYKRQALLPGFWTSTQVSKAPSWLLPVEPSARYQVLAGSVTPMESVAAWRGVRLVSQYMDLSAITGWSEVTTVDTENWPGTVSATLMDCLLNGATWSEGPFTTAVGVM